MFGYTFTGGSLEPERWCASRTTQEQNVFGHVRNTLLHCYCRRSRRNFDHSRATYFRFEKSNLQTFTRARFTSLNSTRCTHSQNTWTARGKPTLNNCAGYRLSGTGSSQSSDWRLGSGLYAGWCLNRQIDDTRTLRVQHQSGSLVDPGRLDQNVRSRTLDGGWPALPTEEGRRNKAADDSSTTSNNSQVVSLVKGWFVSAVQGKVLRVSL